MKSTNKLKFWYKASGFALKRLNSIKEAIHLFNINSSAHPYSFISIATNDHWASHAEACLAYEHSDSNTFVVGAEFWQKPEALNLLFYYELSELE